MTIDDFLNNHAEPFHDYIVRLCYRYGHDEYFHFSNEVLFSDSDDKHTWLNDWDEGYTEVFVIDFVDIDDMFIGFKKDAHEVSESLKVYKKAFELLAEDSTNSSLNEDTQELMDYYLQKAKGERS